MAQATTVGIKLDDETRQRLSALGEARERSPHWLMKRAIHEYLEREEEKERATRETLSRWQRYELTGEQVSHHAVSTWLETWGQGNEELRCKRQDD